MTAYTPDMTTEQRQELLEIVDVVDRLKYVSAFLARQIEILEIKGKIQSDVRTEMDKSQREYFLREQLKAIQRELGIPVKLVGVGEGINDFAFFDAQEFADGLVS